LVLLVVNDHLLKRVCPGFLTGKLSDFAGVLLLPLFLQACYELACAARGRPASARRSNVALAVGACVTVLGFAGAEVCGLGDAAFRHGLGALQWPFYALAALLRGDALPPARAVRATADLTDLVALPMVAVAFAIGRRRVDGARRSLGFIRAPLLGAIVVLGVSVTAPARAEPSAKHTHDGFFMSFQLGAGVGILKSNASISNGFRQSIDSSARGLALPSGALQIGGTLRGVGLVLGGRIGVSTLKEPVVRTLNRSFMGPELQLFAFEGFARWYPNPQRGAHYGLGLGGMSVDAKSPSPGELQRGFAVSLEAGHDFWIAPQWSLAVDARLTAARVFGDDFGRTTVILPTLSAAIVLH
jgi:hypothetical protein